MDQAIVLVTLGVLFLGALGADHLGHMTRLPRVTMLLLLGLLVGQSGFGLLPAQAEEWFEPISVVALTMVAFLLGADLTRENLARHGRAIFSISLAIVAGTTLIVWGGLAALGVDPGMALLLGAIATATAPAAVADVIHQSGVRNGFTETISGIVAIDDVWGLIVFSLCLAFVHPSASWSGPLTSAGHELGGAILLGCAVGLPAAFLTGRLKRGEPLQTEAFGIVFLTAGLALWFEVSFLIAGMTAGALIANLARHHDYAFNEIERIEVPFMLLFFLLAGASLELDALWSLGWLTAAYVGLRIVSRLICGEVGARLGGVPETEMHLYGPALLPQAGVAVGMALVAAETVPHWAATIMTLTIAATVVFELIGPPVTLAAIRRVALAEEGRLLPLAAYDSAAAAVGALTDWTERIDGEIAGAGADGAARAFDDRAYAGLIRLKAEVWRAMAARAADLTAIRHIRPIPGESAHMLAYRLYDDQGRTAEIARRNTISHALFLPDSTLEVLES